MNCTIPASTLNTSDKMEGTNLVIFRRELVQALLNDMVAIQIRDHYHDVQAKRDDDRVNMRVRSVVSLHHQRTMQTRASQRAAGERR